jgi:tetratricopeptide (TPR) repeat protein
MKKMTYWWTRLSSWMKSVLLAGLLCLLIVAGSAVVFDFQSWGWQGWVQVIAAAFLTSLVIVRTLIYIRDRLPGPKIRPARKDELLIVVAKFRGPESPDPQTYIARQLEADLLMHPVLADRVRVSRFPAVIEEESQEAEIEKARALGETYGATLVIWGEHDGHSAVPHYLVTRERERVVKTVVELEPTAATADLDQFVMYVSGKLPETVTYLSLFTIGQMYYFDKEYHKALSLFSSALDSFPSGEAYQESAAALCFYRGYTYDRLDKHDLAIADYGRSIELKSDVADAYNNRGVAYAHRGEYDLAIADCNRAIELKPDYVEVYNNRGNAYVGKGEYDLAITDYNRVIELRPDLAVTYNNRGVTYDHQGEYDLAIADYGRAIDLKPDYAEAYGNRGAAYYHKGAYDQAIADLDRAIELKPDYVEAYGTHGNVYVRKGEYDLAIADFDRAVELEPDLAEVYNNRGIAYVHKGEYNRAIADFTKVIELEPDDARAYYIRGLAHKSRGEKENAIRDFERVLELSEDEDLRKEVEEQLRELRGQ